MLQQLLDLQNIIVEPPYNFNPIEITEANLTDALIYVGLKIFDKHEKALLNRISTLSCYTVSQRSDVDLVSIQCPIAVWSSDYSVSIFKEHQFYIPLEDIKEHLEAIIVPLFNIFNHAADLLSKGKDREFIRYQVYFHDLKLKQANGLDYNTNRRILSPLKLKYGDPGSLDVGDFINTL